MLINAVPMHVRLASNIKTPPPFSSLPVLSYLLNDGNVTYKQSQRGKVFHHLLCTAKLPLA